MIVRRLACLFVCCGSLGTAVAREWESADGRKLEADYVSSDESQVTLKRANGTTFTVALDRLSVLDQSWVKLQSSSKPPAPASPEEAAVKPIEGPFGKLLTGSWAVDEKDGLKFALYGAKNLDAGKSYPLVLALHGKSKNEENGKQVAGWMNSFTKPANQAANPCILVAPMSAQPESGEGMGWNGRQVEQVVKLVKALVKDLPIDPKRIYIVGDGRLRHLPHHGQRAASFRRRHPGGRGFLR
jgi:hypothetical protein